MADGINTTNDDRAKRIAVDRIVGFAKQFGEEHLNLACHAAFPLALTPDLLYQIWARFVPRSPWTAVARVLLSRLCGEVGYEMYEMDIAVRNLLLKELKEQFGQERFEELADFLMEYVAQRLNDDDSETRDLAEAQEWTALAYTKPEILALDLDKAINSMLKQKDIAEAFRISSLAETFAEPLKEAGFEPLSVEISNIMSFIRSGDWQQGGKKVVQLLKNRRKINSSVYNVLHEGDVLKVFHNPLTDFFEDFAFEINGQQRFFAELEYIVPARFSKRIYRFRQQLKELWQKQPIPPIKLTYVSARKFQSHQDEGEDYIVYPVCIYYSHRAPYLFAYGQTPIKDNTLKVDWYDYRFDRIQNLQELEWSQVDIPNFSPQTCQSKTPGAIEQMMGEAYGFDFYKPKEFLLVRFERYFHYRYIEGTAREEIFRKISPTKIPDYIEIADLEQVQKQKLLRIFKQRPAQDIYCYLPYRKGDYNVIMRLRAWGPKVEVLLPWDLRKIMAEDIRSTWKLYDD